MKILIVGKSRLMNETLQESLCCRGFEVQTSDSLSSFMNDVSSHSIVFIYANNELLLTMIEQNMAVIKIKNEQQLKFIAICPNEELASDISRMNIVFEAMLLTNSGLSDVIFAINEVSRGEKYLVPALKNINFVGTLIDIVSHPCLMIKTLTKREKEILSHVADARTTCNIARKLYISMATVNNHKANIMEKLNISGRNKLISTAIALKPWLETAA
jgi:DNA-binding NarL/FixJ family response regulator